MGHVLIHNFLCRDIPEAYKQCEPLITAVDQITVDIIELRHEYRQTEKLVKAKREELDKAVKALEKIEAVEAKVIEGIHAAEEVKVTLFDSQESISLKIG